jgi:4-amino-4-deoxy-L-arabinose transferase-like glycosyltransferase
LGGILLLALLLRAALLLIAIHHGDRAIQPDSASYLNPALRLLSSGSYPSDSARRTPGYPLFIAFIYWLGGAHPILVILVQVLIGTASVYLTFRLGRKFLPAWTSLVGAFLLAISVESITNGFYLLTDTLFTFFLITVMLAWVRAYQEDRLVWCCIAALLMGICVLIRPEAEFLPALLALAWLFKKTIPWIRRIGLSGLFLGIYLASLVPWMVRNDALLGFPTISTIANYNLLYYNAVSLEANLRCRRIASARSDPPAGLPGTAGLRLGGYTGQRGSGRRDPRPPDHPRPPASLPLHSS